MSLEKINILKAIEISRAIDGLLNQKGATVLGIKEVSNMLQRKGIIKNNPRNQTLELQTFLHILLKNNALHHIPQCHAVKRNETHIDWYFHSTEKLKTRNLTRIKEK